MANVAPILEQQLHWSHVEGLRLLARASAKHGLNAYLVGGTVRDMLLGSDSIDLDVSIVGASGEFASTLAAEVNGEVVGRSQFNTAKLSVNDTVLDLVMARSESYDHPGALPSVSPGTIDDDLARRDFTINAMAVSLSNDSWGALLDPFDGQRDLDGRVIRVLHSESFTDDATRILRAIRYAERLGFEIEPHSDQLIRRDVRFLDTISGDRVRHELERIFRESNSAAMLRLARALGVLSAIFEPWNPSDLLLNKLNQVAFEQETERNILYASILSYPLSVGAQAGLISRLNMNAAWASVVRDTGAITSLNDKLSAADLKRSAIHGMLRPFNEMAIRGCAIATTEASVRERLELYLNELRHVSISLDGDDLLAMGVPQGPRVGELLNQILVARLDGLAITKEDETILVNRLLG